MELVLYAVALLIGIVLLAKGADVLVAGSSKLALAYGIPVLIISLIIVSLGTSLPELLVSAFSSAQGEKDIALGNVLGSNIANILLVLGISALIQPVELKDPLAGREMLILGLVSVIIFIIVLFWDFSRIIGILFLAGYFIYVLSLLRIASREKKVKEELEAEALEAASEDGEEKKWKSWAKVVLGLVFVVIGSKALIYSAVGLATFFGIPSGIIALSLIAFGTSLPELATCVVASLKGADSVSLGTIIGSNNFNALVVLGVAALIAPIGIGTGMVMASVFMLIAFAILYIFFRFVKIPKWGGVLMLVLYVIYIGLEYTIQY